jgi:transposase-like protein
MNSRRQQLCERIAEVHAQASSIPRRRYGAALKRDIVDYALERLAEGDSQETIAAELGLSLAVLRKWTRHARLRLARGRRPFAPSERPWPMAAGSDATPAAVSIPASESEPEPTPLMLVLRIEEVHIENEARAQLRAWLATQPEP